MKNNQKRVGRLTQFVLDHAESIKDFRFFMPMETYEPVPFLGDILSISSGKTHLMECRIGTEEDGETTDIYLLGGEHDYKCWVVPVDEKYIRSTHKMYASDLLQCFEGDDPIAFVKEEGDCVLPLNIEVPIGGGFTVRLNDEYICRKEA